MFDLHYFYSKQAYETFRAKQEDFMKDLEDLPAYWMNLKLHDLLTIIYILFMMFVTLASNVIFANYLDSKPAGRKTVIGKHKVHNC